MLVEAAAVSVFLFSINPGQLCRTTCSQHANSPSAAGNVEAVDAFNFSYSCYVVVLPFVLVCVIQDCFEQWIQCRCFADDPSQKEKCLYTISSLYTCVRYVIRVYTSYYLTELTCFFLMWFMIYLSALHTSSFSFLASSLYENNSLNFSSVHGVLSTGLKFDHMLS